jgi:DNA-directed RNA polymerase subunit RPC12/RpoP
MSQKQEIVNLIGRDGSRRQAVATGNNAAWLCPCGRVLPLLGRTGSLKGQSASTQVDCPDCHRHFFVRPKTKDQGPVLEVIEL